MRTSIYQISMIAYRNYIELQPRLRLRFAALKRRWRKCVHQIRLMNNDRAGI